MLQDYSHQNLRGRSFKGQDLASANFSYADIRGADFSGANLVDANFTSAKAGLQKRWVMFLITLLWLCSGLLGVYWFIYGYLVSRIFDGAKLGNQIAGWVSLSILIAFLLLTIYRGVKKSSEMVWLILVLALGLAIPFAYGGIIAICCGVIGILISCLTFIGIFAFIFPKAGSTALIITSLVAGTLALFNIYVGWRALKGDEKYLLIGNIAVLIAATRSTSFCNADLTNANFTKAWLKGANFRNSVLISTRWFNVKMLHRVYPENTYLQNIQLHQLLIRGQGQNMSFDRQDLRGVNLIGANLADASFIGADLSGAKLQDADLTRAKLVQTQLDDTDFTGATLTEAYIEGWNITTDTKFDGVRCEYVYMRLPTSDNPDPHRKPDNRQEVFADGEFGDFIKPIFDTLDLYHSQGVDPRAIAISFKQLAENHPEADLRIVGMEVRGEDKFLLRAKTAIAADKSELSTEYFAMYNQLKALAEQEVQKLIAEKDSRIADLQTMVVTALQRPSFYAQSYQKHGDIIMPEGSKRESNFNLQGAQFAGGLVNADNVTAHQIGGNITNYTPSQKESQTEPDKSAVKTILLLASNPANTSTLRLDQEVREIDTGLQRAKKRELFDLKQRWAVRIQDVYQSFLDLKPQIVHFSGHGAGDDGLVFEDETGNVHLVDTQALARLFELFAPSIECVILNACYSEVQASAIALHIPYVIGMSQEIGDGAAIKFATGFYNALGAGEGVEFAYKLGCSVIQLEGIPEYLTPVLKKKQ